MSNHCSCVKHDHFLLSSSRLSVSFLLSKRARDVSWDEVDVCSPLGVCEKISDVGLPY